VVSSSQLRISMSRPHARVQWVKLDCHVSFGWSASKRIRRGFGAFLRFGGDKARVYKDAADSGC
jgi:hypothetical protein